MLGTALVTSEDADSIVVKGIVISHELRQRRGNPRVIVQRLTVNNFDVQVVGVMRPDVRLVLPAANHVEEGVDVCLPWDFAVGPAVATGIEPVSTSDYPR